MSTGANVTIFVTGWLLCEACLCMCQHRVLWRQVPSLLQASLAASQQANATIQQALQRQDEAARAWHAEAAQAGQQQHTRLEALHEQLTAANRDLQAAHQSEQVARGEVKQLAAALAATHEEHQVCMLPWLRLIESSLHASCLGCFGRGTIWHFLHGLMAWLCLP